MDARHKVGAVVFSALCCAFAVAHGQSSFQVVTDNFIVTAPDRLLSQHVAREAEAFRKSLAIEWIGTVLPRWAEKCPIQVEIAPLAGGETSFVFVGAPGSSEPTGWQMKIFGPPDRILDSVLPHEVTHTIFATYFRRPLPRWADEGACTTVEHESEREKNHRMLMNFLTARPSRGIPFNQMFTMKQYPHDILPLYAQGYSLSRFLIMQRGKRHFVNYIQAGLNQERPGLELAAWTRATQEFYGHRDLSELQVAWVAWVKDGCREAPTILADAQLPTTVGASAGAGPMLVSIDHETANGAPFEVEPANVNWYRQQMVAAKATRTADTTEVERFAPGSTARANVALLDALSAVPNPNTMWRATPIPAAGTEPAASVWR